MIFEFQIIFLKVLKKLKNHAKLYNYSCNLATFIDRCHAVVKYKILTH